MAKGGPRNIGNLSHVFYPPRTNLFLGINDLLIETPGDDFWLNIGGQKALSWYQVEAYRAYWSGQWSDQEMFAEFKAAFPAVVGSSVTFSTWWQDGHRTNYMTLALLADWALASKVYLVGDQRQDILQSCLGGDIERLGISQDLWLSEGRGGLFRDGFLWSKLAPVSPDAKVDSLYIDSKRENLWMAEKHFPGLQTMLASTENRWPLQVGRFLAT